MRLINPQKNKCRDWRSTRGGSYHSGDLKHFDYKLTCRSAGINMFYPDSPERFVGFRLILKEKNEENKSDQV